jgi:hypothetical protein
MFGTITAKEWEAFWRVIDKIEKADEGSERERYIELLLAV